MKLRIHGASLKFRIDLAIDDTDDCFVIGDFLRIKIIHSGSIHLPDGGETSATRNNFELTFRLDVFSKSRLT